ncbi:GtrA family protein [Alphaproteobacteria bacterium]|nr:GtrA family protein [Alphaproteobacteria bacterium]
MSKSVLVFKYILFAALAVIGNLGSQRVIFLIVESHATYVIAVIVGTAVGLLIKYFLDKKWIFYDLTSGLKGHSKKFSQYALTGVLTTLIFWGFETVFWIIWGTDSMRELGALIGLVIGYRVKYDLDFKFVFQHADQGAKL